MSRRAVPWSRPEVLLGLQSVVVLAFALAYRPLDLEIYLWGGRAVGQDGRLYLAQGLAHWFTYTPFAALAFALPAALPDSLIRALWELGSVAACGVAVLVSLRLGGLAVSRRRVLGLLAGALLLEPVWHTLFLGQINLFLLAVILLDLRRVAAGRPAGVGIGLAAAIKLTPGIFIVLLVLARRTRSALIAAGTFVSCWLAGFALAPDASRRYWSGLFLDTGRIQPAYISNQSPYGALLRLTGAGQHPDSQLGAWYLLVPLALGAVGLAAAAVHARHGDWLAAATGTGVTGLLVSPISWAHHWVWIIPALVLLGRDGRGARWAAGAAAALFVSAAPWWTPHRGTTPEYGLHGLISLAANGYLIAGLGFLLYLAWTARRLLVADRTGARRAEPAAGPCAEAGAESPAEPPAEPLAGPFEPAAPAGMGSYPR